MSMDNTTHAKIISLYEEGKYPIFIRSETGVSLSQIYRVLHKAGITIRPQSESHRRHQMDFSFFERVDTQEKAQVLGFIYADGCIRSEGNVIAITLAAEDKNYLDYIKRATAYTGPVYVRPTRRPNEQDSCTLALCSPKMVEDIKKLGCGPRKSLTLVAPTEEQVPIRFIQSFMLGLFEGDGSLSSTKRKNRPGIEFVFTIAGTRSVCRWYADLLMRYVGVYSSVKADRNIFVLRLNGNRQIKRVMDWLYANAPYKLPRKLHAYEALCAEVERNKDRRLPPPLAPAMSIEEHVIPSV